MKLEELKKAVSDLVEDTDHEVLIVGLPSCDMCKEDVHELNYKVGQTIENFIEQLEARKAYPEEYEKSNRPEKEEILMRLQHLEDATKKFISIVEADLEC